MYYKKIKRKDGTTIDEHRVVANAAKLGFNTIVHHIDGDIKNNEPSNLQIMSRSEHCKLHGFGIKITGNKIFEPDKDGMAVCVLCGERKIFEDFCTDKKAAFGKKSRCKECFNKIRRDRRKQIHHLPVPYLHSVWRKVIFKQAGTRMHVDGKESNSKFNYNSSFFRQGQWSVIHKPRSFPGPGRVILREEE